MRRGTEYSGYQEREGCIWLSGCNGRIRWLVKGLKKIYHVQLLPGNRVFVGENDDQAQDDAPGDRRVTVRDLLGEVMWQYRTGDCAFYCARHPNGNMVLVYDREIREIREDGKQVSRREISKDEWPDRLGEMHKMPAVIKQRMAWRQDTACPLPDGNWLVIDVRQAKALEYDRVGGARGETRLPGVLMAIDKLGNENTMLFTADTWASLPDARVVEVDRVGKPALQAYVDGVPAGVCLPLVRVGFDNPEAGNLDAQAVAAQARALRSRKTAVRRAAARHLSALSSKSRPALPVLIEALGDRDEGVRHATVSAIEQNGIAAIPLLKQALKHKSADVRAGAARCLGILRENAGNILPDLIPLLSDVDEEVRIRAAFSIARMGAAGKEGVPHLIKLLKDKRNGEQLREAIALALGEIGPEAREGIPVLLEAMKEGDRAVAIYATDTLGRIGAEDKRVIPALIKGLKERRTPRVRERAAEALGRIGPPAREAIPTLIDALKDSVKGQVIIEERLLANAVSALGQMGGEAKPALPLILKAARNEYQHPHSRCKVGSYDSVAIEIRTTALEALGNIGVQTEEVMKCLRDGKEDADSSVNRAAEMALTRLTEQKHGDSEGERGRRERPNRR
jgi:HEAT repeat protein